MTKFSLTSLCLGVATFLGSVAAPAAAEEPAADKVVVTGPNRSMLHSGVWTLGLSYVPALVVAIESPLPEDRFLFAPVAGPWIDFARRDCSGCQNEDLNKVLLVTDGVVQGIGALEMVGSFLFVETRVTDAHAQTHATATRGFRLRLSPTRVSGGYGLLAAGNF